MKNLFFGILIIFSFLICAPTAHAFTPDTSAVRAELRAVNKAYGEAFSKADSSGFLNAYTIDGCIMPSGSPALCDADSRLAFYKFAYRSGIRDVVFTTASIYGLTASYVTEEGKYEMFDVNHASLGTGKYLVIWKKTPAGWRMFRDMFNSNSPAAKKTK